MKILYASEPGFDICSNTLWSALVENLGDRVVDYPYNPLFHGERQDFSKDEHFLKMRALVAGGSAPKVPVSCERKCWLSCTYDYTRMGMESLHPLDPQGQFATTPPRASLRDEGSVLDWLASGSCDAVVVVRGYLGWATAALSVARLKERRALPPVVMADFGTVSSVVHWEAADYFGARLVFRNVLRQRHPRLRPLPLSCPWLRAGEPPLLEKRYDVLCSVSPTSGRPDVRGRRRALLDAVSDVCARHGWRRAPASHGSDYMRTIGESRVAVSMRGGERDTTHYWMIPVYDTLLLADGTMGCVHPSPFEDGNTAAFYDPLDLSTVETKLAAYLSDEALRASVSAAGREHLRKHHTTARRGAYVLGEIGGCL